MRKADVVMLVAVLTWGSWEASAANDRVVPERSGREITSFTLTRVGSPLELTGRALRNSKHREQHMLMQIKEGEETLHELLLGSGRASGSLKPASRTVDPGVAVWIWGTDAGLRVMMGALGHGKNRLYEPPLLHLGMEEFTVPGNADLTTLEGVALFDRRDHVVVLLYDWNGIAGMRFLSDGAHNDPSELYQRCFDILGRQDMARIQNTRLVDIPGEPVEKRDPPQLRCCPKDCPQCCCTAYNWCNSGPQTASCDGLKVCNCTGPDSCACGPPEQ